MKVPEGYYAVLSPEKESGTIHVKFAEHPGIITYGKDWEEAEKMAHEALNATLEFEHDRGLKLPTAKSPKNKKGEKIIFVRIDPEIRTAYLIRAWREERHLSQAEMAKRLDVSFQAYQRIERPGRANLTVRTLERVAGALGKNLVLEMQ